MSKVAYFSRGTKILMNDNTWRPIEEIKVGDYVMAVDEKEQVKKVFETECNELVIITTDSGRKISSTFEQIFRVDGVNNVEAQYVRIGDLILCLDNNDLFAETVVDVARVFPMDKRVYNLELGENHNVSANGFLCLDFVSQQRK